MPFSPKTVGMQSQMQMGQAGGAEEASSMFEQAFSQMAYTTLISKMPDLVQFVVTFKTITADVESGNAVGAFIVARGGDITYIPVILSENQIKPMEVFYNKKLNLFLPLNKDWLAEADKSSLDEMGEGIKTPQTLMQDVDIRNLVVPPIAGRFSYASLVADVDKFVSDEVLEKKSSYKPMVLDFLSKAPNNVKVAYTNFLEKNKKIFRKTAKVYGKDALISALRQTQVKTASGMKLSGGALWVADKNTKPDELKRVFGEKSQEAYRDVKLKGYASKDTRKNKNVLISETTKKLQTPSSAGVYRIFMADGSEKTALVIPAPVNIQADNNSDYGTKSHYPGRTEKTEVVLHGRVSSDSQSNSDPYHFLVVFDDGSWSCMDKLVAEASPADDVAGDLYKTIFGKTSGDPKAGLGFFVRATGTSVQATHPVYVESVTTGTDGARRVVIDGGMSGTKTVITDPKNPSGQIVMPKGSGQVYMPKGFIFVSLGKRISPSEIKSDVNRVTQDNLDLVKQAGVISVVLKNAGANQISINGAYAVDRLEALKKLATNYRLDVASVETMLDKAAELHKAEFFICPAKFAADDDKKKSDKKPEKKESSPKPSADGGGGGFPGAEGGPPPDEQAMMEQEMAAQQAMGGAPPAPPAPSPTDMAAAEMNQMLEMEMQKIVEKQQMLQQLTMRANEISGGAPMMPTTQNQLMGAPPPSMNPATGEAMPPTQGLSSMPQHAQGGMGMQPPMQQGMGGEMQDPSMMGGGMDQGMQQGMDPSMQMQDPSMMGMDPSMGGMQDPSMMGMQQPPMASMDSEGLDPSMMESQINPDFLGMAGDLDHQDVFDAATLSSLAQNSALKELVGQYVPNLEQALDNLGRVLMSLWMKESDLKGEIGADTFGKLEESLRLTFRNLGELILKINSNAQIIRGPGDIETA